MIKRPLKLASVEEPPGGVSCINSGIVNLQYFQSLHASCPIGIGAISDPSLYTFPRVKLSICEISDCLSERVSHLVNRENMSPAFCLCFVRCQTLTSSTYWTTSKARMNWRYKRMWFLYGEWESRGESLQHHLPCLSFPSTGTLFRDLPFTSRIIGVVLQKHI